MEIYDYKRNEIEKRKNKFQMQMSFEMKKS